jgi:cytidylate kinase
MYRAITLAAIQREIDIFDEESVTILAQKISLDIQPANNSTDGRHYTVLLGSQDITWELRSPAVDRSVSRVSSYFGVRQEMVKRQRAFGLRGKVIMVGRDIGTVVLPDAPLKLFITASAEERAQRRWKDRRLQGHNTSYEAILGDVLRRDKIDSNRIHSPLKPAEDALLIDTTGRSIEQVVAQIISLMRLPVVPESPGPDVPA